MTERALSIAVMRWLRSQDCTAVWKINDFNNVGFPDIIGVYKGLWFSFELKTARGRVSKKQGYEAKRIESAGGRHAVARSLDEVKTAFGEWFEGYRRVSCR